MIGIRPGHAVLTACFVVLAEATAQGALKLDNYTFSKVTSLPGWSFLVKFDKSYAYGEKEDEFKVLCKHAHQAPNFMVAEVPVQEYGDKENDDLRQQFKLTHEDFPTYFLINEAHSAGLRYTGAVKADLLVTWLRRQSIKIPSVGTIEELDMLARKFMQEGFPAGLIDEAKALAEGEFKADRKAPMYVKIMQKILEKGEGYPAAELTRVGKIADGKIAPEKKAELEDKIKILGIFGEQSRKEEL
mmetsp:Transcript_41569/g.86834  ORF Transcript_41569/g.86834 Transcript_41569/m.86834 type:complete len:244 (+) Transcript_41569:65-796(+)|eukprot:s2964_g2.t1